MSSEGSLWRIKEKEHECLLYTTIAPLVGIFKFGCTVLYQEANKRHWFPQKVLFYHKKKDVIPANNVEQLRLTQNQDNGFCQYIPDI